MEITIISGYESDLVVFKLYGKNVEISAENKTYADDRRAVAVGAETLICVNGVQL